MSMMGSGHFGKYQGLSSGQLSRPVAKQRRKFKQVNNSFVA